jgi:lysozyme
MNFERLKENIIRHEGTRHLIYECTAGKLTIGVGHNCEDKPLSDAAISQILSDDIADAIADCERSIENFKSFPSPVQEALVNMSFQMGIAGLLKFKNTLRYLSSGHWIAAADEMLDSAWHRQTKTRSLEVSGWVRECADA